MPLESVPESPKGKSKEKRVTRDQGDLSFAAQYGSTVLKLGRTLEALGEHPDAPVTPPETQRILTLHDMSLSRAIMNIDLFRIS